MLNEDKIKLNNILTSISSRVLSNIEVVNIDNVYPVFNTEKDYFDAVLSLLNSRNATNTTYTEFYKYAEMNNIVYTEMNKKKSDLFIMAG